MIRTITKQQARKFMLIKQGLYGDKKFNGKQGIVDYIKQAGCIQYDPIDVCGKNHELVLQSRIDGFKKKKLFELLYEDRMLLDWFDKNQSICLIEDWPYFSHHRERAIISSRSKKDIDEVSQEVLNHIKENGAVCSADLQYKHKVDWGWAPTSLSRAVLDTLYYRGDLIISHKKNTRKYYDLASRHIDKNILTTQNPNISEFEIHKWQVLRRIGSVGMLHNNASYAFIGIRGLKTKERNNIFESLTDEDILSELFVEDIDKPFYYKTCDKELILQASKESYSSKRIEFIAPLDNLIWDRKLTEEVFDFSYKWEIYTPIKDRKFGYYILPILFKDRFIGRIELRRNKIKESFNIMNIWWENEDYNTDKINSKIKNHTKLFSDMIY